MIKSIIERLTIRPALEYDAGITIEKMRGPLLNALTNDTSLYLPREYLASTFKDNPAAETIALQKLLGRFEQADPTKNKEYVMFIVKCYVAGGWGAAIEDIESKVAPGLELFDRLKKRNKLKPEDRDILKYKTFLAFLEKMDEYDETVLDTEEVDRGISKEVINTDQVRIIQIGDKKAAIYYGRGSKWCTAATTSGNMFDSYNKRGKLYVFLPKKPAYPGEKYQVQFTSDSYMDEKDRSVEQYFIVCVRFGNIRSLLQPLHPAFAAANLYWQTDELIHSLATTAVKLIMPAYKADLDSGTMVPKWKKIWPLYPIALLTKAFEAVRDMSVPVLKAHSKDREVNDEYWLKRPVASIDTFGNYLKDYLVAALAKDYNAAHQVAITALVEMVKDMLVLNYDKKSDSWNITKNQ